MTAADPPEIVHLRAGEDAASRGQWEEAFDSFLRASELAPDSCAAFQGLSVAHHRLGHPDLAWQAAVRAWELDPADPDSRPNLEDLAREQGHEQELATLIEGNQPRAQRLCQQAEAAVEQGRIPDAILAFLEAMDSDPSRPQAWGGIGVACFRRGWAEAARAFFEMAIRLDPSDEDSILNWSDASAGSLDATEIDQVLQSMGVSGDLRAKAVSSREA